MKTPNDALSVAASRTSSGNRWGGVGAEDTTSRHENAVLSADIRSIGLLRGALDEAGIAYDVRNETLPYPGAVFQPEVWIVEDSDFPRACELRDAVARQPEGPQTAWTCPSCGERIAPYLFRNRKKRFVVSDALIL